MRAWERGYVTLNEASRPPSSAVPRGDPEPRIMLHDYHLYLAAEPIRRARPDAILSHFTHIPWPPSSIWQVIPPVIREGIVRGLLANDVVGFQTERYAHNFLRSVETFVPDAHGRLRRERWSSRTAGRRGCGTTRSASTSRRPAASRRRRPGAAPTSCWRQRRQRVIVRVDRLEPSKNILRGFLAFEALLERHPRLRGRLSFLAFLVPSRTSLREYRDYGRKVKDEAERINARFGRAG